MGYEVLEVLGERRFEAFAEGGVGDDGPGQDVRLVGAHGRQLRGVEPAGERAGGGEGKTAGGLEVLVVLGQFIDERLVLLPAGAERGRLHRELEDAAVKDAGGGTDVARGVRDLAELPQEPAVGRQPEGELLNQSRRVLRQLFFTRVL
jgi:hypothetical protein